jgi:hypothetical protein
MRARVMVQSAELASRSPPRLTRTRWLVLPVPARTGEVPQSAAKDRSLARRWGLSPAVMRSWPAVS